MGGGCPSVRWSGGTYADEALSVSAATLLSATSSWLMAHLRLFRPHRGTQSLRFPDHNFPVMRTCAALATQTPRSFQLENVIETNIRVRPPNQAAHQANV